VPATHAAQKHAYSTSVGTAISIRGSGRRGRRRRLQSENRPKSLEGKVCPINRLTSSADITGKRKSRRGHKSRPCPTSPCTAAEGADLGEASKAVDHVALAKEEHPRVVREKEVKKLPDQRRFAAGIPRTLSFIPPGFVPKDSRSGRTGAASAAAAAGFIPQNLMVEHGLGVSPSFARGVQWLKFPLERRLLVLK